MAWLSASVKGSGTGEGWFSGSVAIVLVVRPSQAGGIRTITGKDLGLASVYCIIVEYCASPCAMWLRGISSSRADAWCGACRRVLCVSGRGWLYVVKTEKSLMVPFAVRWALNHSSQRDMGFDSRFVLACDITGRADLRGTQAALPLQVGLEWAWASIS